MNERRKFIRIPEKFEISYNVVPSTMLEQYITSDISQGGIRFLVHQFVPKNSHLKVKIIFGTANTTIEALVQVMWIGELPHNDSYEIGVRFIDIPPSAAEYLLGYIKSFVTNKSGLGDCSA